RKQRSPVSLVAFKKRASTTTWARRSVRPTLTHGSRPLTSTSGSSACECRALGAAASPRPFLPWRTVGSIRHTGGLGLSGVHDRHGRSIRRCVSRGRGKNKPLRLDHGRGVGPDGLDCVVVGQALLSK